MARRRNMPVATAFVPAAPMRADCIPCLEDAGLWYFAERVRGGAEVYEYEVKDVLDQAERDQRLGYSEPVYPGVIGPIRNSVGTNSVAAMMSEGCPPNTGRDYEEV